MATKEQVESWILEYAMKKNYYDIVKALLEQNHVAALAPNMEIRLMTCILNKIISQEDVSQFILAANIVDIISRSVGKFCSVKLYGKIIYMLRMKMLLQHLQKDSLYVLVLLNKNLPRCGLQFDNVNMKELKKLNERISCFRKFFLTLVANETTKQRYFADEYEKEFGEDFMITLKQFICIFMDKINIHLPKTMLEQIFDKSDLIKDHPTSVASFEILLDYMHGKTSLSACELYECWHLLNPEPEKVIVKNRSQTCVIKSSRISDVEILDDEDLPSMRNVSKRNPSTKSIPCSSNTNFDIQRKKNSNEACKDQEMTSRCKDNLIGRHSLHQSKMAAQSATAKSVFVAPSLSHMKQKTSESQGIDFGNREKNIYSQLDRNKNNGNRLLVGKNAENVNKIESKKRKMKDDNTCKSKSLVSSVQIELEKKRCREHIMYKQDISQTNDRKSYNTRARVKKTSLTGLCGLKMADEDATELILQSRHEREYILKKKHNAKVSCNETVSFMNRKKDDTFDGENLNSNATLVSRQLNENKHQKLARDKSDEISFNSDMKGNGSIDYPNEHTGPKCVTVDAESTSYTDEVITSSGTSADEVIISSGTSEPSTSESQPLRREMAVLSQSSDNTQEQVYIISSSSDSHPDSGGSHPILLDDQQSEEKQKETSLKMHGIHTCISSDSIGLPSSDTFKYTTTTSIIGPGDLESGEESIQTVQLD